MKYQIRGITLLSLRMQIIQRKKLLLQEFSGILSGELHFLSADHDIQVGRILVFYSDEHCHDLQLCI